MQTRSGGERTGAGARLSARSLNGYVADPVGSYTAGRNAAVLWPREDLSSVIFWGRPDEHDVEIVTRALEADLAPFVPPHASLVDLRRLELLDLRAFNKLSCQLVSRWERLGRVVTRQALLHGGGLLAAIIGAFYAALDLQFPWNAFADPLEAVAWLGLGDRTVLDDLDRVYDDVSGNGSLLLAVRAQLRKNPASTLEELGQEVGLSTRTLQRRLRELGTTLQKEANQIRLETAKSLMKQTDYPLKCIALDCGCASLQHFSAFFREHVGMPPSRWRALQTRQCSDDAPFEHGAIS